MHVARKFRLLCCPAGMVTAAVGLCMSAAQSVGAAASDTIPGVTSSTITIGMLDDETGVAASTTGDGVGAVQARIDLQNKEGGVDVAYHAVEGGDGLVVQRVAARGPFIVMVPTRSATCIRMTDCSSSAVPADGSATVAMSPGWSPLGPIEYTQYDCIQQVRELP